MCIRDSYRILGIIAALVAAIMLAVGLIEMNLIAVPVSYTHLGGYAAVRISGGGGTGVYHLYKRSAEALFSGGRWLQRYGKAVSYTHIDVYKRQTTI